MTGWKLTIRTSPGALVAAEYECPVHGRFAADVPRGEDGDPPAAARCPVYDRVAPTRLTRCQQEAPFVISAPARCKVRLVEAAIRGKDQKPEHRTWSDMTNLMEGQPVDEWREDRERKVWDEERHRAVKEILNG